MTIKGWTSWILSINLGNNTIDGLGKHGVAGKLWLDDAMSTIVNRHALKKICIWNQSFVIVESCYNNLGNAQNEQTTHSEKLNFKLFLINVM
jgi:hypothetical protein